MQPRIKRCSFCGKGSDEVKYLIAGTLVYICEHCVQRASQVIRTAEADGGEGGLIDLFDAVANLLNKD